MAEIKTVVTMIRALTKKTVARGCTEAEAISAATKIGELLQVYNLSMDEVFLGETQCVTVMIPTPTRNRRPIDSCLMAIAEFCDCYCWFKKTYTNTKAPSSYCFFGLESDTEMAVHLYHLIDAAISTELAKFKTTPTYILNQHHKKRVSVSFARGMAGRLYQRLTDMARNRKREEDETPVPILSAAGTSMVLLKRNKVSDAFAQLGMKLRSNNYSRTVLSSSAYRAGKEAGDRVNLNRPVNGGQIAGYLQ